MGVKQTRISNVDGRTTMKKLFAAIVSTGLVVTLGLAACGQKDAATNDAPADEVTETPIEFEADEDVIEPEVDGSAYGYAGDDPIELAVYKYLVEEVSKDYDEADVHIPTVQIVNVDLTNPDEVTASGDFWIDNYDIEGDTLMCVSGGNYPGVMHLGKEGDGYVVTAFDVVADGSDFESSAKDLFGDSYDDFMAVYGDQEAREELRKITVSDYVNMNDLEITQYQDYGWDPVELYK